MRALTVLVLLLLAPLVLAQPWQRATDGRFIVETASPTDREWLPEVFAVLQEAAIHLRQDFGWTLPKRITVRVYPTLGAYTEATGQPWFIAGTADRSLQMLHVQRLRVLTERGSLSKTLRHELFHLAQPARWPRWRAEGSAMHFAGDTPTAPPLTNLRPADLDRELAGAVSSLALARAAATAWLWTAPDLSRVRKPSSSP